MVLDPVAIDRIVLCFGHRGEAERFFQDVLGCTLQESTPTSSTLSIGAQGLTLVDGGPSTRPMPQGRLAFRVADLDLWHRRLRAAGVPLKGPEEHDGTRSLYLEGPDGLSVELTSPPVLQPRDASHIVNLF